MTPADLKHYLDGEAVDPYKKVYGPSSCRFTITFIPSLSNPPDNVNIEQVRTQLNYMLLGMIVKDTGSIANVEYNIPPPVGETFTDCYEFVTNKDGDLNSFATHYFVLCAGTPSYFGFNFSDIVIKEQSDAKE